MEGENIESRDMATGPSSNPDQISGASHLSQEASTPETRRRNLFATPSEKSASHTGSGPQSNPQVPRYFHSRKINRTELRERPWKDIKDPREKWVTIIPIIGILVGFAVAGFLIWDGLQQVVNHEYCLVLNEDWSGGFNDKIWMKEAEVGGFGFAA